MQRVLSDCQITEVEAVYLCLYGPSLPMELKIELIRHLYETNPNMYAYLWWLIFRWRPLYAKHTTHLPLRCKFDHTVVV